MGDRHDECPWPTQHPSAPCSTISGSSYVFLRRSTGSSIAAMTSGIAEEWEDAAKERLATPRYVKPQRWVTVDHTYNIGVAEWDVADSLWQKSQSRGNLILICPIQSCPMEQENSPELVSTKDRQKRLADVPDPDVTRSQLNDVRNIGFFKKKMYKLRVYMELLAN